MNFFNQLKASHQSYIKLSEILKFAELNSSLGTKTAIVIIAAVVQNLLMIVPPAMIGLLLLFNLI